MRHVCFIGSRPKPTGTSTMPSRGERVLGSNPKPSQEPPECPNTAQELEKNTWKHRGVSASENHHELVSFHRKVGVHYCVCLGPEITGGAEPSVWFKDPILGWIQDSKHWFAQLDKQSNIHKLMIPHSRMQSKNFFGKTKQNDGKLQIHDGRTGTSNAWI